MRPTFQQLNFGWNAEPNAPEPSVEVVGQDLLLKFFLNPFQYPNFTSGDIGAIRFKACSRFRLGRTNDEGWYRGECRYSKTAPAWGEFYELVGTDEVADQPDDWVTITDGVPGRHFLFYFRDGTFECFSDRWLAEPIAANALARDATNA
ncbi:MAG: hypothetical protein R3C00_11465 [Hyphomonas sp.]|nr:hypothetical protein [Hyphomonas sp.]MCB9970523.1 hypothetical protein [Hyphomonas sp.]